MRLPPYLRALASVVLIAVFGLVKMYFFDNASSRAATTLALAGPADVAVIAQLDSAETSNKYHQYEATIAALNETVHGDLYPQLSPGTKYRVDVAYGWASFQLGSDREAQGAYIRATSFPKAELDTWFWRLQLSRIVGDFADAYTVFKVVRERAPDVPLPLNDGNVHGLEQGFGTLPNADIAQLEFETYLENGAWEPDDPFFSRDMIWYHFAQNLLASGKSEKAFEVIRRITDPGVLAVVFADARFNSVVGGRDPTLAVNDAAAKLLEITKTKLASDPKWIEAHSALATRFELLGRPEDALAEIDRALANAAQLSVEDRRHYDFDAQYDHALVVKSYLLFELGRFDEALGIASTIGSGGRQHRPNTDTSLLTATWLIALGRGSEALTMLAPVTDDHLSLEGRGDLAELRACGAAQTGDKNTVETNIRYLRESHLNRPGSLLRALICANDMDAAADAVVAALDIPRQRGLMLQELQRYKPPKVQTPDQSKMSQRLVALQSRSDVIAAVDRVGRINSYDIEYLGADY